MATRPLLWARRLACTATVALLASPASAAPQPSAAVELFGGGGYDSNLFLLVAADPDSPTYRPYAGGFLRVAPAATLALAADSLRVELRAGSDIRQTFGSGTLFIEDAQLTLLRPEIGPIDLRVGVTGGRFDATVDDGLRFTSAGGLLEAAWRLFERWRFTASYRLTGRWFGAPALIGVTRDLAHEAELRAAFIAGPTSQVALSAGYLDLRSTIDQSSTGATGQIDRLWAGLDGLHVAAPRVTLFASLWAGAMRPDGGPADLQIGGAAAAWVTVRESLDAVLRYEGLVDHRSADSSESSGFQRHVVTVGLLWRSSTARPGRPAEAAPPPEAPGVSAGRVRFTLRAPEASIVRVVGSWNDWAASVPAQVMRPTRQPGLWEVVLPLPPGTHRFQYVQDGRAIRPPAAAHYRADDFGAEDAIVEVPGTP